MKELGLEVETLEKSLHVSSPLGTRVSVDMICQDCELEISGILLTVDLSVTPHPDEVHSTCNCKDAYVHQVPL